jgi:hypothetical protein
MHSTRVCPRTARIQHTGFVIKPQVLACLKLWMLDPAAREWKVFDGLDHATNAETRFDDILEVKLVKGRTPRYNKRVVY